MESPKKNNLQETMKPYRALIDDLDRQIIELLRQRYDVIEHVGHLKARENFPATIAERVDEVCANAERMAQQQGLDAKFIRRLYEQLVAHSCALEDTIIGSTKAPKKKAS